MNTDTGIVRDLEPDEELPHVEDLERIEMERGETPTEVEVPPSYVPMTPEQRLVAAFGYRGGKDRKASRPPKKSTRELRYERAQHRKRMQAKRGDQ